MVLNHGNSKILAIPLVKTSGCYGFCTRIKGKSKSGDSGAKSWQQFDRQAIRLAKTFSCYGFSPELKANQFDEMLILI